MVPPPRIWEIVRMNSSFRRFLLVALLAIESVLIVGCANTGRGLKRDTQHNLDKVESELKH